MSIKMYAGTYIGLNPELYAKTAILYIGDNGTVFAQFDDTSLPQASGWHNFKKEDFLIDNEDD